MKKKKKKGGGGGEGSWNSLASREKFVDLSIIGKKNYNPNNMNVFFFFQLDAKKNLLSVDRIRAQPQKCLDRVLLSP
jgi:hypothetical protein